MIKNEDIVEIFKPIYINGEKTNYIISDHGKCINLKTKNVVRSWIGKKGKREYMSLYHHNKKYTKQVARWMALTFLKLPFGTDYSIFDADHIDENPFNNYLLNIQWLTKKDNSIKTNTLNKYSRQGEKCSSAKLTELTVCNILEDIKYKGLAPSDICKKYNLYPSTVTDIIKGRTWRYLYEKYNMENFIYNSKIKKFNTYEKTMIKKLFNDGLNAKEIAKKLNLDLSQKTLKRIKYYKKYDKSSTTIENNDDYYTIEIH